MNGINIVYTCIEHNRLSQCNIRFWIWSQYISTIHEMLQLANWGVIGGVDKAEGWGRDMSSSM